MEFGSPVPVGTNFIGMVHDTALGSYTHLVFHTKSSLAEQSTPTSLNLTDVISSVSSLRFVDKDLDAGELGGMVTWEAPQAAPQAAARPHVRAPLFHVPYSASMRP